MVTPTILKQYWSTVQHQESGMCMTGNGEGEKDEISGRNLHLNLLLLNITKDYFLIANGVIFPGILLIRCSLMASF